LSLEAQIIWVQFAIAAGIIVVSGYPLSRYGNRIAKRTGLGQTFLGIILFSTVTSLPELAVCITSTSVADMFFTQGAILAKASPNHILTAVLGIVVTNIVIMDLIYRAKKVPWRIGWGSISTIALYFLGSITLFKLGIR
jgi:cation:H+ antiporter